jgi:glycosyltransferase 2 family protein
LKINNTPDQPGNNSELKPENRTSKVEFWQILLGLALSIGSIILAFQGVDFTQVLSAIAGAVPGYIALALAASVATLIAKAIRWKYLFHQRPPSFKISFSITNIGSFINSILPARIGDLIRAYLMGEENHQSKVYVLGTIVVEKIFDLIFIVISIGILLPQIVFPTWVSRPSELTAIFVLAFIIAGGVIAWKREMVLHQLEVWSKFLPARWRAPVLRQTGNLLTSLECVRNFKQLVLIFAWTLVIWVLGFGTNLLVFWAMGLPLSILPAIFLLVVLQVGVAVPSSPGRIGVFHYLTVLALSVFAIDKGVALSCGIILHLIVYVPLTILGAFYIWQEKISWSRIMKTVTLASFRGKN